MTISLLEISIFLISITFFILVIYLIPAIIQLRQTARSVQELTEAAKLQVKGLEEISNSFKEWKRPAVALATLISFIRTVLRNLRKEG